MSHCDICLGERSHQCPANTQASWLVQADRYFQNFWQFLILDSNLFLLFFCFKISLTPSNTKAIFVLSCRVYNESGMSKCMFYGEKKDELRDEGNFKSVM